MNRIIQACGALCPDNPAALRRLASLVLMGTLSPLDTGKVPKETFSDIPLIFARQRRFGTRVPKQWYKSPAELDFYGEFDGSALRRVPENALCAFPFRKN